MPRIRHRRLPDRLVGDKIVVACPDSDDAVVLAGAAASVWLTLDEWTSPEDVGGVPATDQRARAEAAARAAQAVELLDEADLLERDTD